jgi:hypothetical protein
MRCDESPQGVEIEITQKHPASRLHEPGQRNRINVSRGKLEQRTLQCGTMIPKSLPIGATYRQER